jgi:hypothetical protein
VGQNCKIWATIVWLAAAAVGCSGRGQTSPSTDTGAVTVALTGSGQSGATYHLTGATFDVTNFFVFPPVNIEVSGDEPSLQLELAASIFPFDYQISLRDGWVLNSVNPDGTEQPVTATLLTNFIPFTIKPRRTTPVAFQFKASEQVITTGNGTASINVAVDDTLIDDFEDGDGLIAPIGRRNGGWFVFNDGSGTQTPAPGTPVVPEVLDTSAQFMLHTTGTGFAPQGTVLPDGTSAFGAGVGASLVFDATTGKIAPYDASQYGGIQFTFSTKSSPDLALIVSFLIGTSATTPVDLGGTCTEGCFDDFGFVGFVPPGEFTFSGGFDWGALRQQGFGTPATFDPATILNVKWIVAFPNFGQSAASDSFDFRLDDVAFRPPVVGRPAVPPPGGGRDGGGATVGPEGRPQWPTH